MNTRNNIKYYITKFIFSAIIVFGSIAIFSACEKEIEIDLPRPDPKIVIEGWIENGQSARVIITKSAPYFDPIDSTTLANSLVTNATVTVSDGTLSENLTLGFNPEYFPYIMYMGSTLKGVPGKTYSLTVQVDGATYTSETTILEPLQLDSVWYYVEPGKDSLGYVWAIGSDPGETEDFYRVFSKRLGRDQAFVPMIGSTWEDKYFNGQEFTFSVFRGEASYLIDNQTDSDEFGLFRIGDTIVIKLARIPQPIYEFWSAAEAETFAGGNPFSTPALIPSNIKGGALGVWSGYASTMDTIIASY